MTLLDGKLGDEIKTIAEADDVSESLVMFNALLGYCRAHFPV